MKADAVFAVRAPGLNVRKHNNTKGRNTMRKKGFLFEKIEYDYMVLMGIAAIGSVACTMWFIVAEIKGAAILIPPLALILTLVLLSGPLNRRVALRIMENYLEYRLPDLDVMRGLYRYRMSRSEIVLRFEDNKGAPKNNIILSRLFLCRTKNRSWFLLNVSVNQRGMFKHLMKAELQPITEERAKIEVVNFALRENIDLGNFSKYFDELMIKDA